MKATRFATLLAGALCASPAYPAPEADCAPANAEVAAAAQAVGLQREAGMIYDGELVRQRQSARDADLARLKERLVSARAARNEAGEQPAIGQ